MSSGSYTEDQEKIALEVLSKDRQAFYEVLRIERSASDNEIKKSYRKLAIKLHPDKNPHPRASEAFKVINRAFEVLSDEEKRRLYDRLGRDPDDRNMPSASSSGFRSASAGFPAGFENSFYSRRAATRDPGEDIFDFCSTWVEEGLLVTLLVAMRLVVTHLWMVVRPRSHLALVALKYIQMLPEELDSSNGRPSKMFNQIFIKA